MGTGPDIHGRLDMLCGRRYRDHRVVDFASVINSSGRAPTVVGDLGKWISPGRILVRLLSCNPPWRRPWLFRKRGEAIRLNRYACHGWGFGIVRPGSRCSRTNVRTMGAES